MKMKVNGKSPEKNSGNRTRKPALRLNKGRNFILNSLVLLLCATSLSAFTNMNGGTGLYRSPTAASIGAENIALSLPFSVHGWDRHYADDYPDALLFDQYICLTYGFNPFLEGVVTGKTHADRANGVYDFSSGDTRIALKLIYPPYPHREEFDLAILAAYTVSTGSKNAGFFRRRVVFREDLNFSAGDPFLELQFPFLINFNKVGSGAPLKFHTFFGGLFTTTNKTQNMYQAGAGLEYNATRLFNPFFEVTGETKAKKGLTPDMDPLWFTIGCQVNLGIFNISFGFERLMTNPAAKQVQIIRKDSVTTQLFPRFGGFVTLAFSGNLISQDSDHDGLDDDKDKCPQAAEDVDEFQDSDGCPDVDNDNDGILDISDKCPNNPEDRDGFADEDGCPDRDNDNDGIPDSLDKCLNTPEDMDNFEDNDGCPELDNDKDGIPDGQDKCPNQPEDPDGFADEDGCPDIDNDKDGIPDKTDKCPNTPETFNGLDDADGCPDGRIKYMKTGESLVLADVKFKKPDLLLPKAEEMLIELAAFMNFHKEVKIEVRTYSDAFGSTRQNRVKTEKQADAIKLFLMKKDVADDRLRLKPMGEESPIASNSTSQGREANNRVEVIRYE